MFGRLKERLKKSLISSSRIHLRQEPAANIPELIALLDRFLDGPMRYELEWDDFISWRNDVPAVEQVRLRIAELESLAFSKQVEDRELFRTTLIDERNRLAALLSIPLRS
ncbi:MAG TPA: hypothetical protein VHW69_06910 [Rhizomicrobium sp.]|jgi:hypothetical protein|nr:hypothetical protein [Rhizomicrobium sp.]